VAGAKRKVRWALARRVLPTFFRLCKLLDLIEIGKLRGDQFFLLIEWIGFFLICLNSAKGFDIKYLLPKPAPFFTFRSVEAMVMLLASLPRFTKIKI
jgi:hypothetical protein